MSILDRLIAEDPNPELSNLDLLQLHGSARYRAAIDIRPALVRPIAHRRRSTHVRLAVKWGEVVSMVALFAAIALMSGIIAAVLLGSVGAL